MAQGFPQITDCMVQARGASGACFDRLETTKNGD